MHKDQPISNFDKLVITLSFVTLIEVPLSIANGEYLFVFGWVDLVTSMIFMAHSWRHRKEKGNIIRFLSSLPLEFFILSFGIPQLSFLPALRCIRLLRGLNLRQLFKMTLFRNKTHQLAGLALGLGLIVHWVSCGWMMVHDFEVQNNYERYAMSLYWAITTLVTVGYGDITPQTYAARFYAMGSMVLGIGLFGVVIAQISSLVLKADKYQEEKKKKMYSLMDFLDRYEVPPGLTGEVMRFFHYYVDKNIAEQDGQILSDLPEVFQIELKIFVKIKFLKQIHIFQGLKMECLRDIAMKLEEKFYSPEQEIVTSGMPGREMFIISHGEVEVLQQSLVVAKLRSGQVFGEVALIEEITRTADVVSSTYSDILTLSKDDFFHICQSHPELKERFFQIYSSRRSKQAA